MSAKTTTTVEDMNEDFDVIEEDTFKDGEIEHGNIVKLTKAYSFEERKIDRLDFSGFKEVELDDMNRAADVLTNAGRVVLNPEMDPQYCLYIAAVATHTPHEFFTQLGPTDIIRIRNKVRNLFYGRE